MADQADDTRFNPTLSRYRIFCSTNPVEILHQPISQRDLMRLDQAANNNHIPAGDPSNGNPETPMMNMNCCCGRSDCAYLEHNNAALGGLERDLETAARLGQALLDRHEAYVKEAQTEQGRLSSYITDLENEKTSLQDSNHRMVVENRELLHKLEQLNTDLGGNGKRVHELETLLHDCEQEIRRLHGLTRKAQEMEVKMLDMERERADTNKEVQDGKSEARSSIARWRDSERKVRELEQEVLKIEWAARVDREKHEEIVGRMAREHSLERELGLSEGRLKASAAVQDMQRGGPQKQVVSNFVRDILQDNANLQTGIAELRELLQSSNDEVQSLREQVMLHQPLSSDEDLTRPQRSISLSDELALSQSLPKKVQQEVHVHHHYHTKLGSKKEKTPTRRTPRRRAFMPSGALSSSPSTSGASTPLVKPHRYIQGPAPLAILPPQPKANRWSTQSTATNSTYMSSTAGSPRSHFDRNSSIFDRIEHEEESSRPTSPESFNISSPLPFRKRNSAKNDALSAFEEEEEEDADVDEFIEPLEPVVLAGSPVVEDPEEVTQDNTDEESTLVIEESDLTPRPSVNLKSTTSEDEQRQTLHCSDPHIPEPLPPPDTTIKYTERKARPSSVNEQQHYEAQSVKEPSHNQVEPAQPLIAPSLEIRPSIRRSNSHDSLLSISGMDIHLAQAQHPHTSQRSALRLLGTSSSAHKHYFAPTPATLRQPLASATQPLASVTEYTAISRPGLDTPSASMLALNGIRSNGQKTGQNPTNKSLIESVGGWVTGKWGRTPGPARPSISTAHFATSPSVPKSGYTSITPSTPTPAPSTAKRSVSATALQPSSTTPLNDPDKMMQALFGRTPGINQSGPIPGFAAAIAAKKVPTLIDPGLVDVGGLEESLAEQ